MNFISIEDRKYHNSEIFVTTDWLEKNRLIEDLVVLDLDEKDQYEKSHIPGALNVSDNYYKKSLGDRTYVQDKSQIEDTFSTFLPFSSTPMRLDLAIYSPFGLNPASVIEPEGST